MITKRNGRVRMQEKWLVIAFILMTTPMPFTFLVSRQESRKQSTGDLQSLGDVSLCVNQQESSGISKIEESFNDGGDIKHDQKPNSFQIFDNDESQCCLSKTDRLLIPLDNDLVCFYCCLPNGFDTNGAGSGQGQIGATSCLLGRIDIVDMNP